MLLKCVALSLIIMSISQYRTKHNNYSLNKLNNIDWNNFRLNKKSLGNVPDFYIFTGGTQSNGKIRTMKSLSLYCVKLQHRQRTEACPYMTRHGFNHLFWINFYLSSIWVMHWQEKEYIERSIQLFYDSIFGLSSTEIERSILKPSPSVNCPKAQEDVNLLVLSDDQVFIFTVI